MKTCSALLYLSFDGVLHPASVWHRSQGGPRLDDTFSGHALFEHADELDRLLSHYPHCGIVLSTRWVHAYGFEAAVRHLPAPLQRRVLGFVNLASLHGPTPARLAGACRGSAVALDAVARGVRHWVALDESYHQWSTGMGNQVLRTHPTLGLATPGVWPALENWLMRHAGASADTEASPSFSTKPQEVALRLQLQ